MSMTDGKKRQIDEEIRRLKNMKRFILHEEESVQLAMKAALDEMCIRDRGVACAYATVLIIITYGAVLIMNTLMKFFGVSRKIKQEN